MPPRRQRGARGLEVPADARLLGRRVAGGDRVGAFPEARAARAPPLDAPVQPRRVVRGARGPGRPNRAVRDVRELCTGRPRGDLVRWSWRCYGLQEDGTGSPTRQKSAATAVGRPRSGRAQVRALGHGSLILLAVAATMPVAACGGMHFLKRLHDRHYRDIPTEEPLPSTGGAAAFVSALEAEMFDGVAKGA
mmetsp:Transcript_27198/g.83801  ORF Transcript_27198/g.83801 Transcript_27198/m.83801 type:complete len:192 (+) Transcript_27198:551-1126(+)